MEGVEERHMGRDIQGGEEGHIGRGHTRRGGGSHGEGTYREGKRVKVTQ